MSEGFSGFSADVGALETHAAAFKGLAERADDIRAELASALAEADQCWGTDEVGRSFAAGHAEPASAARDAVTALPAKLQDVGERFRQTAHAYRQADAAGAAGLGGQG